jgi:uncharacterized protein (DUF305 family)
MKMKFLIIAALTAVTSPVFAQPAATPPMTKGTMMPQTQQQTPAMDQPMMPMGNQGMMAMMNNPANPYGPAEMGMHQKMVMATAGQPSELWTRKMIEHHRGAIEMSRVVLEKGTDAQTRRMAQKIITDQGREITQMQTWLRSHGKAAQ